jgi:transcriptional regulator
MVELKMKMDFDVSKTNLEAIEKSGQTLRSVVVGQISSQLAIDPAEVERLWNNPERICFKVDGFEVNVRLDRFDYGL